VNNSRVLPTHQLHMRVYEPLVAFPPEQRRAWTAYVAAHPPSNPDLVADLYQEIVRANAVVNGPRFPRERTPHAYIAHHDGRILICPVQLRFRSLRAAESRPDLFSPTGLAHGAAAAMLASLREEEREDSGPDGRWDIDDGRVRARTAMWFPPVSWLATFVPEDRINPDLDSLIMRVPIARAVQRLKRVKTVLGTLRGGIAPDRGEVSELRDWFSQFHPKGVVEIDYGGTVNTLLANSLLSRDDDGLPFDDGPADLQMAMDAAKIGDLRGAIKCYRRVFERIQRAQWLSNAS